MGLLGGMARTAVVAGTATHVSNNVSRRQSRRYSQQDQAGYQQTVAAQPQQVQPIAPTSDSDDENLDQLERLGKLYGQGVLTDEEFAAQKKKILAN